MSSYICDPKHFNSIEKEIKNLSHDINFSIPYSLREICSSWYSKGEKSKIQLEISNLIDTLRELNVICVCLQYKSHFEGVLDNDIKTQMEIVKSKTSTKHLTLHGLYNALQCLNYQIETEHLKDLFGLNEEQIKAMKFLKEFTICVGAEIISNLPEDRTNSWSIE